MTHLFDYPVVIKHNSIIKTGEILWPAVAEAVPQAGVIWHSRISVMPHSITHCSKSRCPSRVQWKRSTQERAPLIKALLNLTISVRYRRAIIPQLFSLSFSLFLLPPPTSSLHCYALCFLTDQLLLFTPPLPLRSRLFFFFPTSMCEKKTSCTFLHF